LPRIVLPAKADSGRDNMHNSTIIKSLFLKREPSFLGLSEIFRTLSSIRSQKALDCAARELIETMRRARLLRDSQLSHQVTNLLLTLPASEGVRNAIRFYDRLSQPDAAANIDKTREALFSAADSTESEYVPRIILEVACTYDRQDDLPEALRYYVEAGKGAVGTDPLVAIHAAENIAFLRSNDGDHLGALRELERLWPVVGPLSRDYIHLYYSYFNNLAIVLSRAGRIEESRIAIARALSSPLALRFPEWRETEREIEEVARQESKGRAATLTVVSIPAPRTRSCKTPIRAPRNSPAVFLITFLRQPQVTDEVTLTERDIVSPLLERYIKTVRIRDSP
jgi:tetratricopeptide (TPR) repeat protein